MDTQTIRRVLAHLEPLDARPEKLAEIFGLKDKLSALPDPVYILLTDETTGEQMRIYDQAEIRRLKRDAPHEVVEIVQIGILFHRTDELAAVQGVLKAARGDSRDYGVFVTRPDWIH